MRHTHAQSLRLWMNGVFVGTWSVQANAGDVLQYDDAWVSSGQGRPLSLSLPFTPGNQPHRGNVVRNYFDNLLPDSKDILARSARRFGTGSTDAFALLAEIGRDCVGALQILPDATPPCGTRTIDATPLNDAEVAQVLRSTLARLPMAGHRPDADDDLRISIAGAQEKTALLWLDGQWCRPHGATPTTHILKMPLGLVGNMQFDMSESVDNEWLCSEILHAYGVPVARTRPVQFEDMKVLVVERFDRRWWESAEGERWLLRLPQEDMCQALGVTPHLKYESDGGPGVRDIMKLLATSQQPARDRRTFFQAQVLFWMLGATDGHAKNFSIFLHQNGAYELTPLYDVLSAYPIMGTGPKCCRRSRQDWPWLYARRTPTGKFTTYSAGTGWRWEPSTASRRPMVRTLRASSTISWPARRLSFARFALCCLSHSLKLSPKASWGVCKRPLTNWLRKVHPERKAPTTNRSSGLSTFAAPYFQALPSHIRSAAWRGCRPGSSGRDRPRRHRWWPCACRTPPEPFRACASALRG